MRDLHHAWPLALLMLLACGQEPPAASPGLPSSNQPVNGSVTESDAAARDSLRLSVHVPARVVRGVSVPIGLEIANVSGRALDLYLRGRDLTVDIRATNAAGTQVWHRLENEVVPAILQLLTLAPGETLELAEEWRPGAAAAGRYEIRAELLTETGSLPFPPAVTELVP